MKNVRYSRAVVQRLINGLVADKTMREICAPNNMPTPNTVYKWLSDNYNGLADEVNVATKRAQFPIEQQALEILEDLKRGYQVLQLPDEDEARPVPLTPVYVQACKVRLDHLRWRIERLDPRGTDSDQLAANLAAAYLELAKRLPG